MLYCHLMLNRCLLNLKNLYSNSVIRSSFVRAVSFLQWWSCLSFLHLLHLSSPGTTAWETPLCWTGVWSVAQWRFHSLYIHNRHMLLNWCRLCYLSAPLPADEGIGDMPMLSNKSNFPSITKESALFLDFPQCDGVFLPGVCLLTSSLKGRSDQTL